MEKDNLNKTISQIFESRYIIPLYQRNFAWRREQIETLLRDIFESYRKDPDSNYFVGSLIVMKRGDDYYEVIDGQQRLTVLSIITQILGINKEQCLYYDSRPHVEEFFKELYAGHSVSELQHPSVYYLKEAVDIIKTVNLREDTEGRESISLCDADGRLKEEDINGFANYFKSNVILLRVEIPEETDVATYFEIMNNRGEQLQEHEILKSLMMAEIKEDNSDGYDISKQQEFALIWDACSQMDEPIQKIFKPKDRKRYFGDRYDDFKFENLTKGDVRERTVGCTIDEILSDNCRTPYADESAENEDLEFVDESNYTSIIDFPNFLMHIFKAFYEDDSNENIPLDAKYLLQTYDKLKAKISSEEFIRQLFRSRVFLDRYVIKTIKNEKDEDGVSWSLRKPNLDNKKMDFVNTFRQKSEQDRVIKALTMLQVTFRTRKYKNWLNRVVKWFDEQQSIQIDSPKYLKMLDGYVLDYYESIKIDNKYEKLKDGEQLAKENSYSLGVNTPHFLFNFIDYLYWVESKNSNKHNIKHADIIRDFDFKYWNSVEHHLARNKVNEDGTHYIDNLGNLCLISKGANSRLSDRIVKEKVEYGQKANLGANRQIMYYVTRKNNYEWGETEILEHYNDLLELISKRYDIIQN